MTGLEITLAVLWIGAVLVFGYGWHLTAMRANALEVDARTWWRRVQALEEKVERQDNLLEKGAERRHQLRNDLTVERAYAAACNRELERLKDELAGKALFPTLNEQDLTVRQPSRPAKPGGFSVTA